MTMRIRFGVVLCALVAGMMGQPALAIWSGASSGTDYTSGGVGDYDYTGNWAGSTIDDSFSGVELTGDLTVTLDNARTTVAGGLNLNYDGDYNLSLVGVTSSRAITLVGNVSADTMAGGRTVTIGGGSGITLNLNNSTRTFTVGSGDSLIINGVISSSTAGSGKLTKDGSGVLTLNAASTYTGQTTVNGGELRWGIANAIAGGAININDGGTVNIQTFSDTVGTITIAKGGAITGTTGILTTGSGGFVSNDGGTMSGFSAGAGLQLPDEGPVTYNHTVPGSTTLKIARIILSNSTTTHIFTIANGEAAIDFEITGNLTAGGSNVPKTIRKTGAGVMQFSGSEANTNGSNLMPLNINEGTVIFNKSAEVNALPSGTITVGDGIGSAGSAILQYRTSNNQIGNNAITINSDGLFDLNGFSETTSGALALNCTGQMDFNGGTLTVGAVTIVGTGAGANTTPIKNTADSGGLTVTSLVITPEAGYTTTLSPGSTGVLTLGGNATFTAADTGRALITGGTVRMNGDRTYTVGLGTGADYDLEIESVIGQDASNRNFTKAGTGRLRLSGANSYAGITTIQTGTFIAGANAPSGAAGALGSATSDVILGVASGNNAAGILTSGAFTIGRIIRNATSNTTDTGTRVLTLGGNSAHNSEFSGNIFLGTSACTSKGIQLTAAAGGQVTFSGVIQETGGIRDAGEISAATALDSVTKGGAGTVILSNANTFLGKTVVSEGTLLVNNTTGSGTGNNTVTVTGTSTLGGSGTIAGSVTVGATGNLAPGGSAGTLNIGGALDISALAGDAGKLYFDLAASEITSDRIAVTGTLTIGDGVLALDVFVFNDLDGMAPGKYTLITSGGISGTPDTSAGTVGSFNNASLAIEGNNLVLTIPVQGGQPTWIGGTSADWSVAANWSSFPVNDLTTDVALFNLPAYGGNPVFAPDAGTTSINGIQIGFENGPMTLTANDLSIGDGGIVIADGAEALSINGTVTLGAAQSWLNHAASQFSASAVNNGGYLLAIGGAGDTAISAAISGTGGLTKSGTGTLTLPGTAQNTYSGATTINAGTLAGVTGGSSSNSAVTVSDTVGATLGVVVDDNTEQWVCASLTAAGGNAALDFSFLTAPSTTAAPLKINGDLIFTGIPAVTLDPANLPVGTFPLIEVGGTAPVGIPTVTITGSGAFTGTASWNSGVLSVTIEATVTWNGAGDMTWSQPDNNSFDATYLHGANALFTPTGAGTVTIDGGGVTPGNVIVDSTANYTFTGGGIGGTGSLTKMGSGTLTLTNANSFSGGVFINGGILNLPSGATSANLGDSGNVVTFAGNGSIYFTSSATFSQGFVINAGVAGTLQTTKITATITNSLAGSGTLNAEGNSDGTGGNLIFTSTNNTFSGDIAIYNQDSGNYVSTLTMNSLDDTPGRRIKMGNNNSSAIFTYGTDAVVPLVLSNRQIEHYANFATLNNNATDTSSTVTVNTDLLMSVNANRTFTIGGSNSGNNTFAGAITNKTGYVTSLTKAGAGKWIVSNPNNTFTGTITFSPTTTSAGTLAYASAGGTNPIAFSTTTGSATLSYIGAAPLTMSGLITASALTTGTITLDASGVTSADTINYSNTGSLGSAGSGNKNLILSGNNTGTNTLAGVWANNTGGAATLTKNGAGTWVLSGANIYTGATTLNAGTLRVDGSLASVVTVNSSGTLGGSGTIAGASASLIKNGAALVPGSTVGMLTFSNGLTLEAGATVALELGVSSDSVRVSGGTFTCPASGTVTVNITAAGSIPAGEYTLIDWTGTLSAVSVDLADFTVNLPASVNGEVAISGTKLLLTASSSGTTFRFR